MSYIDGRRSSFPKDGADKFLELYNLPASQKNNMKRYQELTLKDSLTTSEQSELNTLTINLQHYIIDVEKWNKFADAIVNVEKFFLNETVGYIKEKQEEFQVEVDKLTYRGEWQPNTQYFSKNIVTSGGVGYIAKRDNKNQSPQTISYWGKIADRGEKGDPSLNINFKGEYDSSQSYVLGDAVTFGGLWYYASKNTKGNPPTNSSYWELQTNQTLVGDVEPFDERITLWINTNLGRAEYWDETSKSRKVAKASSIVDNSGLEYTPRDIKAIDKNLSDHAEESCDFHTRYAKSVAGVNVKNIPRFNVNPIERLVEGVSIAFKNNAENTSAVTFNINDKASSGYKTVLKSNGQPLTAGTLKKDSIYTIRYNGVNFILQGEGGEYGTALTGDVIKGKTIGTEEGIKTGTLELIGNATPSDVLEGNTFYKNDPKRREAGTMPDNGYLSKTITRQGEQISLPSGRISGGNITTQFANLTPSNIKEGVNVGGIVGNLVGVLDGPYEVDSGVIENDGTSSFISETITVAGDIVCVLGWPETSKATGVYFGYAPFVGIGRAPDPTPSNYVLHSVTYDTKRKVTIEQYSSLTLRYMIVYKG